MKYLVCWCLAVAVAHIDHGSCFQQRLTQSQREKDKQAKEEIDLMYMEGSDIHVQSPGVPGRLQCAAGWCHRPQQCSLVRQLQEAG